MRKNVLKLVLYSIILLITVSIEAQGQRGQSQNRTQGQRGQSQNRAQGQGSMPVFNAENATGILTYSYRKVIKKTKNKKAEEKNSVEKIISEYNHTIDEIKFLHSDEFRAIEKILAKKRQEAMANRDREAMRFIQSETMKKLIHIKSKVQIAEQELNGKLELVFSEKQYNKWIN